MKKVVKAPAKKKSPFGGKQALPFGKKAPQNTGTSKLPKSMSYIAN